MLRKLMKSVSMCLLSVSDRTVSDLMSFLMVEFIDAYKAAALGLKSTREKSGLTVESMEDAMEDFQNEVRTLS